METTYLDPTIGHLVWRLSMKWRAQIDRAVLALGLTHAQYSLLASLYGLSRVRPPPSQRQLADFSGIEVIYVSKLIKALERDGLVARTTNRRDSRAVELNLTDAGREHIEAALPIVHNFIDTNLQSIGGLGSEDDLTLRRILKALLGEAPAETRREHSHDNPTAIDGRDLGLAFQATVVLRDRVLARHGRTFAEFAALRVLSEGTFDGRDAYVSSIARNLQLNAAQVEALLAGLEAAGLIKDGTSVELTPAGNEAFTNLARAFQHTTAQVYANIDAADIATTREVLHRVQAQAEALAASR